MTSVQKTISANRIKKSGLLPLLLVFATLPSPGLWSQTFRTLYHFGDDSSYDGSNPRSGLTLIGNTLFGTTHYGGHFDGFGSSAGIVFSINTDATEYKLIF